jgi:ABC-type amino acid transport substrate-binding protein
MTKTTRLIGLLAALALVLAACSPADEGGEATTTAADETTSTEDMTTTTEAMDDPTTTEGEMTTTEAEGTLPDLGGRTVTVAVENAYLPFNYILAGETEGQGWDYDAWRDICERLNCVPEFPEAAWPAVIDQVAQGEFDTSADGISITEERMEVVDFSDPYMVVQQKFIKQLGDDRFNSADDVINSDAIVATQVGTTNFELAADLVGEDRIQAWSSSMTRPVSATSARTRIRSRPSTTHSNPTRSGSSTRRARIWWSRSTRPSPPCRKTGPWRSSVASGSGPTSTSPTTTSKAEPSNSRFRSGGARGAAGAFFAAPALHYVPAR